MPSQPPPTGDPYPYPCGGTGQPICPPQPALSVEGVSYYSAQQMHAHGLANYQLGLARQPNNFQPQVDDL